MSEEKKYNGAFSETDDFWSLESLLPPTEKRTYGNAGKKEILFADFEIDGEKVERKGEKIPKRDGAPSCVSSNDEKTEETEKISFEKWLEGRRVYEKDKFGYGKRTVLEYSPGGRYIKKVTISEETGRRVGGERFITDGQRLLSLTGKFHGNVPFESFYPQYSQLNAEQRACYIGFRTEVVSGRYPEVSRSYIYLYLYEIINISTELPSCRAERIASLINAYKECDDRLFSDMCRWLCDLCLIHQLKIPNAVYGDVFPRVLECAQTKEVFLDLSSTEVDERLAIILSVSRYDYRKSKFYPEFSEYYDRYIPEAVSTEIEKLSKTDSRFSDIGRESCKLTRESFFGAFCLSSVRRTISVELRCITGDETVKKTVSDMVKYAENRLRAKLMIKPRLSVIYLPVAVRDGIKAFFAERGGELPKKHVSLSYARPTDTLPEYEKLYEPTEKGISEQTAKEIEKSSWEITERLISSFDGEEAEHSFTIEKTAYSGEHNISETSDTRDGESDLTDTPCPDNAVISALKLLLNGDSGGFKALANESGYLVPAFADLINEMLYEELGDSAVYVDGESVSLVEDYVEDIKDIVKCHN